MFSNPPHRLASLELWRSGRTNNTFSKTTRRWFFGRGEAKIAKNTAREVNRELVEKNQSKKDKVIFVVARKKKL
ncbi:MAG: hypothetical protein WA055_01380 [Candidatus Moraniibacteriota bacterium]